MKRFMHITAITAIGWSLFQLYTAWIGFYPAMIQRPLHVTAALALAFLAVPRGRGAAANNRDEDAGELLNWPSPGALDITLALASLAIGAYVVIHYERLVNRVTFVDPVATGDIIAGVTLVGLLLEACRRVVGWTLPLVALFFLVYLAAGPWLPGVLRHSGISVTRFVELQTLSTQGIFGVPTGVSSDFIFYFILFSAFLKVSGGGELFMDLAFRLTGRARGGPAKAAVVGSALMGSISGSAVANVASTGIFTIPLMKRSGYPAHFAGGLEAVASTGGQITPPVLGAAAFIMAEMIGRPYSEVVIATIIPALAYYVSLYFMVDFVARQRGLRGLAPAEMPQLGDILQRLHLLVPLVLLVYFVIAGASLQAAALRAILAVILISFFRRSTRLNLEAMLTALAQGGRQAMQVTIPAATAGIIVGVITYTGVGLQFSSWIIQLSQGVLLPALLLVMLASIILGMGMPTSGAYIMAGVLMAPALMRLGVPDMAAHMFVFYFAALSMITPPVALASYAAAGISGSGLWETSWTAVRLALAAFLVPFAFVYNPLLVSTELEREVLWPAGTLLLGTMTLAAAVIRHSWWPHSKWESLLLFVAALGLIAPERVSDWIGLVILLFVMGWRYLGHKASEQHSAATSRREKGI